MDTIEEELLAVEAIFPGCVSRDSLSSRRLMIRPFAEFGSNAISLTLLMPEEYPAKRPVILGFTGINQIAVEEILENSWTPGEVCLYVLVDHLRELSHGANTSITRSNPRRNQMGVMDVSIERGEDEEFNFAISDPIIDRKSTFVGRAVEVHSRAEVKAALLWLKQHDKKVPKATHNIVAWRVVEDGILMQGCPMCSTSLIFYRQ